MSAGPAGRRLAFILPTLLAIVAFAQTVTFDFVWDDRLLIEESTALSNSFFFEYIGGDYFSRASETQQTGYFRPTTQALWWLEYRVWGQNPAGYHATNVLLHALCSLLAFLLLRRLLPGRENVALIAACLFAVHPVHIENVAWISGRTDILASLFVLLAGMAVVRGIAEDSANRYAWLTGAGMAFAMACGAKEVALVAPLFVLLCAWFNSNRKPLIVIGIAGLAISAGYWLLRAQALGDTGGYEPWAGSLLGNVLFAPQLLLGYAQKLVFPFAGEVRWEPQPSLYGAFAGWLLLIAAVVMLRKHRMALLALAGFGLGLLPVLQLVPIGETAAERYLYLPSLPGLVLLVLLLAPPATRRVSKRAAMTVAAGVLLLGLVLTWQRNGIWRDPLSLWAHAAERTPQSSLANLNYGKALEDAGELLDAHLYYDRAVKADPDNAIARFNLARALQRGGRYDEALEQLSQIPTTFAQYERAQQLRVQILLALQRAAEAKQVLAPYCTLADGEWLLLCGNVAHLDGDHAAAVGYYRRGLDAGGPHARLLLNLGVALSATGDVAGAVDAWRKIAPQESTFAAARIGWSRVLAVRADLEGALRVLEEVPPAQRDAAVRQNISVLRQALRQAGQDR